MDGYQGVSWRSSIQRQSGAKGSIVQTGLPKAPARCATEVSTEISKSRLRRIAAVSSKSDDGSSNSTIFRLGAPAAPFCNPKNTVSPSPDSADSSKGEIERLRSFLWRGFPDQVTPTLRALFIPAWERMISR